MDNLVTNQASEDVTIDSRVEDEERMGSRIPLIVFFVVSAGFLIFLAIGTVEARIWRFGRLNFEDRSVRHVWSYLGDHLPDMPGQPVISALYWISVVVMVVGTILGLWLFLGTPDEDPASDASATTPEPPAPHA